MNFSGKSELIELKGDVLDKIEQLPWKIWGSNTNLHAAFEKILTVAKAHNVHEDDMPEVLLIMSDMQFDHCTNWDDSAKEMISREYTNAGYTIPSIVFWNIRDAGNVPVKSNAQGVGLVSGFSPAIVKNIIEMRGDEMSPTALMMNTIMVERYDPMAIVG